MSLRIGPGKEAPMRPSKPWNQRKSGAPRSVTLATALAVAIASLLALQQPMAVFAQTEKGPPRVRHVYIPQEDLETIFGEGKKGALLTRDEFKELWQKAHGESPQLPPADAVLTRARYEAELAEHEIRITAHIQLVKLQDAWQTVEIQFGGVAIESAEIDGQPAKLGRNSDGCLLWVTHDKGRYELSLKLSVPVIRTGGDLTAWLQIPPLPSSEFVLRVPQDKQVRVRGVEVNSATTRDGTKAVRIPIDQSGHVPLAILDSAGASNRTPLIFANSMISGTVEPSGVRWQADMTLDVAAQPAAQFRLTIPRDVEVASVESPDLSRWTPADDSDERSGLILNFRQPFQGQRRLRVIGLAPIKLGEPWSMPTIAVTDAVSNVGEINLQPAATLRLEVMEMAGIRRLPISGGRAPATQATSAGFRFAFWTPLFTLQLRATPRERELSVALASLIDVARTGLTLRTSVTIEPRYASLFEITLGLPRDW